MKLKLSILITLLIAAVLFQPTFAQDDFKPKTVFLIRHAEREDEPRQDPPLKKEGIARSQELARLLSSAGIKAIYASQFTRTK
jgi:Histidine phosphatase superfamily (branch 1)